MRIIPAIDIIGGKCVRLSKGDYSQAITYNENPLEVAREFEDNGIQYLHLVDLDGAKSNKIINWKVLRDISKATKLEIDFGGGIKSNMDLRIAFENGASKVTGGSVALKDPGLFLAWLSSYGPGKIILGADCRNRKIMTNGWISDSETDVVDYILEYEKKGVRSVVCTDIEKDGMMEGPSFDLYKEIIGKSKSGLIASGGISSVKDLEILKDMGCEAAIVGKAIYEGKISLSEIRDLC